MKRTLKPGFSSCWADRLWGNKRSQIKQKHSLQSSFSLLASPKTFRDTLVYKVQARKWLLCNKTVLQQRYGRWTHHSAQVLVSLANCISLTHTAGRTAPAWISPPPSCDQKQLGCSRFHSQGLQQGGSRIREWLTGTVACPLSTARAQKRWGGFVAKGPGTALPAPLTASQHQGWQTCWHQWPKAYVPQPHMQNEICNQTTTR